MRYETIFEITQKHPDWAKILLPVIIMIFIGVMIIFFTRNRQNARRTRLIILAVVGVSFSMDLLIGWSILSNASSCRRAYEIGDYSVVEGMVSDFKPISYEGRADEEFNVNGVRFHYSDHEVNPGFNHTSSQGGPLREGLRVKISYSDTCSTSPTRCILKLEIQPSAKLTR